jgi:hypothetical protein
VHRQPDVPQLHGALHLLGAAPHFVQRRHEHRQQEGDDADDEDHFDQRQGGAGWTVLGH